MDLTIHIYDDLNEHFLNYVKLIEMKRVIHEFVMYIRELDHEFSSGARLCIKEIYY